MNSGSRNCSLYWIHLAEHSDITSEGYVGITVKSVSQRFKEHKWKAGRGNTFPLSHAIKKYGENLICTTLLEGSQEYCRLIEGKLRPAKNTGWNINIGGTSPPMTGRKHSEVAKARMSSSNDREASRQRMLKHIVTEHPWNSWRAIKEIWLDAERVYQTMVAYPDHGVRKVQTMLGIPKELGSIQGLYNRIKTGFIPSKSPEWITWVNSNKLNLKEIT